MRTPFSAKSFCRSTRCTKPLTYLSQHPFNHFVSSRVSRVPSRSLHASPSAPPPFAFAFDIDGVLLRSSAAIPGARAALSLLQRRRIPFILLTNGGGKCESERVADVGRALGLELDVEMFVQSHSPFEEMVEWRVDAGQADSRLGDGCVLVVGGEGARCREVAKSYGYNNVIIPSDIYAANPTIWPFSAPFSEYHRSSARPLPLPVFPGSSVATQPLEEHLRVAAVHVYNDPRDWGFDLTLLLDLLLSHKGYLGTVSGLNGRTDLPNRGYLQDGQPELTFTNPDLWWAAAYHLSRLGQGGFKAALEGVWNAATQGAVLEVLPETQSRNPAGAKDSVENDGGVSHGGVLGKIKMMGKPHAATYAFAERRLRLGRQKILRRYKVPSPAETGDVHLSRVYMIGDNPMSDVRGANNWTSANASKANAARWRSILVRSGVYTGGKPAVEPEVILDDVREAVEWALEEEGQGVGEGEMEIESS